MQIAKWNKAEQKPYDIRDRNSVTASNGVPYRDMISLNRIGYYEYQPVQLDEGEGLDNPTYAIDGGVIRQVGTVVSSAEMQARAEADALEQAAHLQSQRHDRVLMVVDAHGKSIKRLAHLLSVFGLEIPISVDEAMAQITDALDKGELTDEQTVAIPLLEMQYRLLKASVAPGEDPSVADTEIAAAWSIIKQQIGVE